LKSVYVLDVMGLLTSIHYDFIVYAADSLATVVRLELTDEMLIFILINFFSSFRVSFDGRMVSS
jgi:hypothetical protein